MSLRLVRSPDAPKMTMRQGPGLEIGRSAAASWGAGSFWRSMSASRLLFRVAAEFLAHRRKDAVGEIGLPSRREALEERRADHGRGHALVDGRQRRPAALARVGDA